MTEPKYCEPTGRSYPEYPQPTEELKLLRKIAQDLTEIKELLRDMAMGLA